MVALRNRLPRPWAERLLAYREIDVASGCWLWTGARMKNGYGVIGVIYQGRKSNRLVHRVSASVFLGYSILSPLLVLHKCDVRHCFNPDHLFHGTQQDNMTDMWNKGRGPDQRHPKKLNPSDVRSIRSKYRAGGVTTRSLAASLGLGKSTIEAIINRRIWAHVID